MTETGAMRVSVSVATLWTSPSSPRSIDRPALENPVAPDVWLAPMTLEDRRDLCDSGRVQTQALYGTRVVLIEQAFQFGKVIVLDQACSKDPRGYPGWLPMNQLLPDAGDDGGTGTKAVVARPFATLFGLEREPLFTLSYATELVVLDRDGEWVQVATPHGARLLWHDDVALLDDQTPADVLHVGRKLVEDCQLFLGRRYLWAGTSAFGFDCSGLTYAVHKRYGIQIPRDAIDQARAGRHVDSDQLLAGDLLFFAHERGKGRLHHVGMYAGMGRMIHSPNSARTVELVELTGYELEEEHVISRRYW